LDRWVVFVPGTGSGTWIEEVKGEVWEGRCDVCEVWGAGTGAKHGMGGVKEGREVVWLVLRSGPGVGSSGRDVWVCKEVV